MLPFFIINKQFKKVGVMMLWIPIGIVAVIVIWVIAIYNKFKRMQVMIKEAWSNIDVQLKRKANIIPNLIDSLKMQMDFESNLLTELTAARTGLNSNSKSEAMAANDKMANLMPQINAVAEAYPQLGTNSSFLQLMGDIRDCEDKVAYARNRYNITVARYNADIVLFPNRLIAGPMALQPEQLFEITETQREDADNMRISQL